MFVQWDATAGKSWGGGSDMINGSVAETETAQ